MFECNQGDPGGGLDWDWDWTATLLSSSLPCEPVRLLSTPPVNNSLGSGRSVWRLGPVLVSVILSDLRPIDYQYVRPRAGLVLVCQHCCDHGLYSPYSLSVIVSVSVLTNHQNGEGLHPPGTTGELHSWWTLRWRRTISGKYFSSFPLSLPPFLSLTLSLYLVFLRVYI